MHQSGSSTRSKGNDSGSGAAADSTSESSRSRTALVVPPPETPWTHADLARALHIDPSQQRSSNFPNAKTTDRGGGGGGAGTTTTTIFSFPFTLPGSVGPDGSSSAWPPLPSLATLLPRPLGVAATAPTGQQSEQQNDALEEPNNSGVDHKAPLVEVEHISDTAATTTTTTTTAAASTLMDGGGGGTGQSTPLPTGMVSKSSCATVSLSGVTQACGGVATPATAASASAAAPPDYSQGHSLSSVSSDTTVPSDHAAATELSPRTPHAAGLGEANAASSPGGSLPRSPLQSSSHAASSFTDLFVGLERPRLHRRPRQGGDSLGSWNLAAGASIALDSQDARASQPSSAIGSTTSHNLFSLIQNTNSLEASSHDEVKEDEGGAHTPTVYRGSQLPHWWRSIVTPSVGTRVCLRPNTPRLEFWWIDRLGSEAYELMQVILRHSLEGIVLRESGEAVVVVEFTIPAEFLGMTSFAVWRPREAASATGAANTGGGGTASPSGAALPTGTDPAGDQDDAERLWQVGEESEEAETTLEATMNTLAPPLDGNEGTITPVYVGSPVSDNDAPRLSLAAINAAAAGAGAASTAVANSATATNSTITIGRAADTTGTHSTGTSDTVTPTNFPGLPVLVRADSPQHGDAVDPQAPNNNLTLTSSVTPRADGAAPLTPAAVSVLSGEPPRAAPVAVVRVDLPGDLSVAHGEQTSVPSIRHCDSDLLVFLPHQRSISADTGAGCASLSTVGRSGSSVTGAGRHSDPFAVERRFHNDPPLTRVLETSPFQRQLPATPALPQQVMTMTDGAPSRAFPVSYTSPTAAAAAASLADFRLLQQKAGGVQVLLRTPVTPGEKGYSPDPSDDTFNDTSVNDSHGSGIGEEEDRTRNAHSNTPTDVVAASAAAAAAGGAASTPNTTTTSSPDVGPLQPRPHRGSPLYALPTTVFVGSHSGTPPPRNQQQQQPPQPYAYPQQPHQRVLSVDRTGSVNSHDNDDPSVLRVDDGSSLCQTSTESPHHRPSSQYTSSGYNNPSPRSRTYGEWLRTNPTPSTCVSAESGLVAAAPPPWSHDDPNETTHFLGKTTSVSEANAVDGDPEKRESDDVVVRLSLPSSVCIPIVAVRLHALQLLHPLLDALTIPYSMPAFQSVGLEDDDDDGVTGALLTATQVSPFTSELVGQAATPDYSTAVQIVSDAITHAEEDRLTSTTVAPPTDLPAAETAVRVPTDDAPPGNTAAATMEPRDLSILYTIRSHLYFHMSPEYLYDSLKDAESALACCPTHEHVCNTYEVLTACLISFGHTAQVERVAAHLRHRCRSLTPLLTRLGRVTQVMVSYGTLFLRQQLSPALLRHPLAHERGRTEGGRAAASALLLTDATQSSSPLDGAAYLSRAALPPSSASASAAINGDLVTSTTTAMPLVVVGGGIVDPPVGWGHASTASGGAAATVGGSTATATAPAGAPRTLPYEVCPLLLGYYGKSLHGGNEIPRYPHPQPPLSPRSTARQTTGAAVSASVKSLPRPPHPYHHHSRHSTRPSNDVCHRRLFLLETLFPSVMPLTAVNRLQQVFAMPRPSVSRTSVTVRNIQNTRLGRSISKATGEEEADTVAAAAAAAAAARKKIKPEDFMYDRDSMFALLATTTETAIPYGTISMRYFGRHIRLSATRRIPKGETVLLEKPALMLALWPLPRPRPFTTAHPDQQVSEGEELTTPAGMRAPAYCAQCGRQQLINPVCCPGGCGTLYCCEGCRREALRLYHVMECPCEPATTSASAGQQAYAAHRHSVSSSSDGDDDDNGSARVRRAVAALQPLFAEWNGFLYHFANWDTPSTRSTTPAASCSPSVSAASTPAAATAPLDTPAATTIKKSPPPILAVTGLRAMARLVMMMLCMVLPVETLPQWRAGCGGSDATLARWTAARHADVRSVTRTLRHRGLMVPAASRGCATNLYCSAVDPHRLLLLEVMLQQLSIPFFADFTYDSASTVWEAVERFPSAVQRKATPTGRNGNGKSVWPATSAFASPSPDTNRGATHSFAARATKPPPRPGQRHWFVELTIVQREELMTTIHDLLHSIHDVVDAELTDVFALPPDAPVRNGDDDAESGAPLRWTCAELFGFLSSTRVFEELLDFCLTSCAVVYPQDTEPRRDGGTASPVPTTSSSSSSRAPPAIPLAVISPWTCLTVDLHPILGHGGGSGVIYSRFMVEHEQRRRMIAYCAAAATRRGGGGANLGGSGYGSGVEDDSFLSVHSMASASAAAVLSGSIGSPNTDDPGKSGSIRDEWNLQMLEEAASRSCANLTLSLVHSPPSSDATRPATVAVVMTAKKNIQLGDVLWWESLNFGEYLHPLF